MKEHVNKKSGRQLWSLECPWPLCNLLLKRGKGGGVFFKPPSTSSGSQSVKALKLPWFWNFGPLPGDKSSFITLLLCPVVAKLLKLVFLNDGVSTGGFNCEVYKYTVMYQSSTTKLRYIYWRTRARRWLDNIRMDLQEVGCGYMDWIGLAQDRDRWRTLVSAVMNLGVRWNSGNFLTGCKPVKKDFAPWSK